MLWKNPFMVLAMACLLYCSEKCNSVGLALKIRLSDEKCTVGDIYSVE